MNTGDITLVYRTLLDLNVNQGLIMKSNEQSIAILKRKDTKGIYYSIKESGANTQYDDSDAIVEDIRMDEVLANIDMEAMIHHQIYIVENMLAGDLTNESRIEHTTLLKDLKEELGK